MERLPFYIAISLLVIWSSYQRSRIDALSEKLRVAKEQASSWEKTATEQQELYELERQSWRPVLCHLPGLCTQDNGELYLVWLEMKSMTGTSMFLLRAPAEIREVQRTSKQATLSYLILPEHRYSKVEGNPNQVVICDEVFKVLY